ncbi:MAG: LysR substrate-binding domain-containing protein [Pseudomonadota bacterium]
MAEQRKIPPSDISSIYAKQPQLPPLAAVRAFEAAARHLSFTRAAEELNMSQAAVSYQIKLLEKRLGLPLFERLPRQVVLSEAGQRLAPPLLEAFQSMRAAFAALSARSGSELSITTLPTIGVSWLAPRLGAFQLAQPRLSVRLDCSIRLFDLAQGEFDVAIRSGDRQDDHQGDGGGGGSHWPGMEAHRLMNDSYTPLLSPQLLRTLGRARLKPADLLKFPLYGRPEDWRHWLGQAGVAFDERRMMKGVDSSLQHVEVSAALSGHGVAMANPQFYRRELAAGTLLQPFERVLQSQKDYWLVYPSDQRHTAKLRAFRDWILAQARDTAQD